MTQPRQPLSLYRDSSLELEIALTDTLEFGRQRGGEPSPYCRIDNDGIARVIIDRWDETSLSRRHCVLTLLADGQVLVANTSSHYPIFFEPHEHSIGDYVRDGRLVKEVPEARQVSPGQKVKLPPPFLLSVGATTILAESDIESTPGSQLLGLETQVSPPQSSPSLLGNLSDFLGDEIGVENHSRLMNCMEATLSIFHRPATSPDFLPHAAQAMIDTVGLEVAAVLTRSKGDWKTEVVVTSEPAQEISWRPSRTILSRVASEKRTFRQVPLAGDRPSESLMDVNALVVAPILDVSGEVIGALYGDRRTCIGATLDPEVSTLEAKLVELMASAVAAGFALIEQEKIALESRVQFEQFFTPELSRELAADQNLLQGREAEVSLLFGDITGFSRISERIGTEATVAWINDVLGRFSECVLDESGVLVDYVGDELFAMWGAPTKAHDQAQRACRAALKMQECLAEIDKAWFKQTKERIGFGIGINTGIARVGNVGSQRKFKYGPLGNSVNLASRVQGATKHLRTPVLITGATAAKIDPQEFSYRRLCKIRVVNIIEPVEVYELIGNATSEWIALKTEYEKALDAFEQSDFSTAAFLLARLLTSHRDDGPSILLLSRVIEQISSDDVTGFEPVWQLSSK